MICDIKHTQVLVRTHLWHNTSTERQKSYVDLYRDIDKGQLCSKIYDKRDVLHFPVVNLFSWLYTSPPPLVTRCLCKNVILFKHIKQIIQWGLRKYWTYWQLQTLCGRHHDLVEQHWIIPSQMLANMFQLWAWKSLASWRPDGCNLLKLRVFVWDLVLVEIVFF